MDPIFYSSASDPYYSSRKNEATKFKLKHLFIKQFIIFYSLIILHGSPFSNQASLFFFLPFYMRLKVSKGYPVTQELFFQTFALPGVCQHFSFHY